MLFFLIINIIILLILIIILYFAKQKLNGSSVYSYNTRLPKIYFFTKLEAQKYILNDKDHYIKNMTKSDLLARGNIETTTDYKIKCATYAMEKFTKEEKYELIYLFSIIKTNPFISGTYNFIKINDNMKYNNIKYENGYPHTRENIIFIPSSFFANNEKEKKIILLHECIHIYQRYNPKKTEFILNSYHFFKVGNFKELFPYEYTMRRSNPDLDNNIWKNQYGDLMFPIYNSLSPKNMNDVLNKEDEEHPYEWMAYHFSQIY